MKTTHPIFPFMPCSRDISTDKQADGETEHCCTKCMVVGIRHQCSTPRYGIQSQSTRKSACPGRYGALTRDEATEASYRIYVMTLLRINFTKEPTIISSSYPQRIRCYLWPTNGNPPLWSRRFTLSRTGRRNVEIYCS